MKKMDELILVAGKGPGSLCVDIHTVCAVVAHIIALITAVKQSCRGQNMLQGLCVLFVALWELVAYYIHIPMPYIFIFPVFFEGFIWDICG